MRMTREQFEKLLYDFSNAAAESWRKDTIKEYNNSRSEILAEFDRLNSALDTEKHENADLAYQVNAGLEIMREQTAEIERLRRIIGQIIDIVSDDELEGVDNLYTALSEITNIANSR